jgi:hypothetical protein
MISYALLALLWLCPGVESATGASVLSDSACLPGYRYLVEPVQLELSSWDLSFRVVAVGCEAILQQRWPPSQSALKRALELKLYDIHAVQVLVWIKELSPQLRTRIVGAMNEALGMRAVSDVFIFDARGDEYG